MSTEDGIRRTIAQYCQLFDARCWEDLGYLFAEGASVTSRRGTFTGRSGVIRDLQHAMADDYHGTLFTANSVIAVDGGAATAVSDFMQVEDGKILATGTYTDTFTQSDGVWVFATREIRLKIADGYL